MKDKKVKVLHVIADMGPGGAQMVVINYLKSTVNHPDYELSLAVLASSSGSVYEKEVNKLPIKVQYCNFQHKGGFSKISLIFEWLRGMIVAFRLLRYFKPDIIHTHQTAILPFFTIPTSLCGICKRFHTLHSDPDTISSWPAIWGKIAFRKFSFIPICVSNPQKEKAMIAYGIKYAEVVHNGIDYSQFEDVGNSDELRKELGIVNSTVIGTVGRLHKVKNYKYLLEVFKCYHQVNPDSVLLFVGDGPEKESLKEISNALGLTSCVLFLGHRKDVVRLYRIMNLFLLTSFYESSSLVTVEAQLSGLRCVVSDSLPEDIVISDKVSRLSINLPAEKWADEMITPLSTSQKVYPFKTYSMENMVDDTLKLYAY